jgi:zinc protease
MRRALAGPRLPHEAGGRQGHRVHFARNMPDAPTDGREMKDAPLARHAEHAARLDATTTRARGGLKWAACGALAATLAVLPRVAPADEAAYRPSEVERAEPPHAHRLPNGLTVLIAPSHRAPRVAMDIRYDAGSRREAPDRPGVARLALRALLDGGAHTRDYGTRAGRLGTAELASFSDFDAAGFDVVVAPDAVESVLWLWSDQMGFGRAAISEEALTRDRATLARWREAVEATRGGCIDEAVDAALFPAGHPYALPSRATRRALDAVTVSDVRDFYDRHFAPDGAILTIVGDVEEGAALAMATRYFGDIPAAPAASEPALPPVRLDGERSIDIVSAGEGPAEVVLAWPTAGLSQADDTALDVLSELLAGDRWSDLGYALVTERKLATSVEARQRSRVLGSVYKIRVVGRAGVRDRELVAAVDDLLRDIGAHVTAHGVKTAVSDMIRRALAQSERVGYRADRFAVNAATTNDPAFFPKLLRRLMTLTPASIVDTVRRQLPLDRRLVAHVTHAAGAPVCGARVPTTSGASAGAR